MHLVYKGAAYQALGWAMKHITDNCVVKGRVEGGYVFVDEGIIASMYGNYA